MRTDESSEQQEIKVAAYFNPATRTWVARHTTWITLRADRERLRRENVYGYGSTFDEMVQDMAKQLPAPAFVLYARDQEHHLHRHRIRKQSRPAQALGVNV